LYWAQGGKDDGKALADDAAILGLILPVSEPEKDPDFYVLPENWPTVMVFLALGTAWRIDGMSGVWKGLDYPSVKTVMWAQGVKKADRKGVFNGLQIMERAVIDLINSKLKK